MTAQTTSFRITPQFTTRPVSHRLHAFRSTVERRITQIWALNLGPNSTHGCAKMRLWSLRAIALPVPFKPNSIAVAAPRDDPHGTRPRSLTGKLLSAPHGKNAILLDVYSSTPPRN